MLKFTKFVLSFLILSVTMQAQPWSYVYIQGDKETPFYVKLEDEMLPRYSKNYCIIPQLEAGPIHIQILFQQNQYPPQNFTILVPDTGYRGFILTRKDNNFSLYDIHQHFYLASGVNGEDHLPEMIAVNANDKIKSSTESSNEPIINTGEEKKESDPQFINNVELNREHTVQDNEATEIRDSVINETPAQTIVEEPAETIAETPTQPTVEMPIQPAVEEPVQSIAEPPIQPIVEEPTPPKEENKTAQETPVNVPPSINEMPPATVPINNVSDNNTQQQIALSTNRSPIINSDCPEPLNDHEFDQIYNSTKEKNDDKNRLTYLMKKAKDNCFTTRQVYFLTREINAESMRYSFLKKVYSHVTDQQNFKLLEDNLFKTLEWKSYFRTIP